MNHTDRPGRNDPCPCGSGKKYKKCCLDSDLAGASRTRTDDLLGTPLDEYILAIEPVMDFCKSLIRSDPDRALFRRSFEDIEQRYHPGSPDGIFNSVFISWSLFDLRFGPSSRTVGERFLDSDPGRLRSPEVRERIRELNESFLGFYKVLTHTGDHFLLREFLSGSEVCVQKTGEGYELEIRTDNILLVRLVTSPQRTLFYTTPSFLDLKDEPSIMKVLEKQADLYLEVHPEAGISKPLLHRESYKAVFPTWMQLLFGQDDSPSPGGKRGKKAQGGFPPPSPHLVNRDGDPIRFTRTRYGLIAPLTVVEGLKKLKVFDHQPSNKEWTWLAPRKRGLPESQGRTVLGMMRMTKSLLILETNSEPRMDRLQALLEKELGPAIAFRSRKSQSPDDVPALSPSARTKWEKEKHEFHADPQMQEMLRRSQEDYYLKVWPDAKIPALGGKSPRELVKTESGRRRVLYLLREMEGFAPLDEDGPVMDFERVRRLLGLPSSRPA